MKVVAIAMAAVMGLFFVSTEAVQAFESTARGGVFCKSGHVAKDIKYCKENGGTR